MTIQKDGKDRDVLTDDKRKCPKCRSIMVTDGTQYTCTTCAQAVVDHDSLSEKFGETS